MSKIDTSNWGEFKVGYFLDNKGNKIGSGLFEIVNSVAYHNKDIEEIDVNNPIGLNYITRSKFNNGLKCKVIDNGNYKVNPSGTISFGAENANFFYQKEKYITGNKMYYIDTSSLSELSCAFLKSILEATFTANYSFSDGMIPSRIYNETIKLPIDVNGNPDWAYMEKYMSNLEVAVSSSLTMLQSAKSQPKKKIETNEWKEFKVEDLGFKISHGTRIKKSDRISGSTIFLTAGKENMGVIGTIGNNVDIWANPITIDMFGNCFYHPYKCFGDDNIYAFINNNISDNCKNFIASSINAKTQFLYSYTDQFRQENANNLLVYLPIDTNEQPDWDYMEQYMKNVEQKVNNSIGALAS